MDLSEFNPKAAPRITGDKKQLIQDSKSVAYEWAEEKNKHASVKPHFYGPFLERVSGISGRKTKINFIG